MVFNKPLVNPSLRVIYPAALDNQKIVEFTPTNDTAYLYMKNMDFDSLRVSIIQNSKPVDSISLMKGRKESFQKNFTFSYNVNSSRKLNPFRDLVITTSTPIDSFDPSMITLQEDSAVLSNYTITRDTTNTRKFILKYRWKEDSKYLLTIDAAAFSNIYGDKNKKAGEPFTIDRTDNYSNLTLKVTVPDTSKAYIAQIFLDERNILRSDPITKSTALVYKNFYTGKYYFRVIYDSNRNGKWDTGNVRKKIYPENIWLDPVPITLRPNWEAEESLTIPRENGFQ